LPGRLVCGRLRRFAPLWVFGRERIGRVKVGPKDEGEGHLTPARAGVGSSLSVV
jgi:hypothetical protein